MPAIYDKRCKTCNSKHRLEIEKWYTKDRLKPSVIHSKLLEKYDEDISRSSLYNHFDHHYNVTACARELAEESEKNLVHDAGLILKDVEILDKLIQSKLRRHEQLDEWLSALLNTDFDDFGVMVQSNSLKLPNLPMAYVSLYESCASEVRQAVHAKKILFGDNPSGDDKIMDFMELVLRSQKKIDDASSSEESGR